jgi:hypothetical protein
MFSTRKTVDFATSTASSLTARTGPADSADTSKPRTVGCLGTFSVVEADALHLARPPRAGRDRAIGGGEGLSGLRHLLALGVDVLEQRLQAILRDLCSADALEVEQYRGAALGTRRRKAAAAVAAVAAAGCGDGGRVGLEVASFLQDASLGRCRGSCSLCTCSRKVRAVFRLLRASKAPQPVDLSGHCRNLGSLCFDSCRSY